MADLKKPKKFKTNFQGKMVEYNSIEELQKTLAKSRSTAASLHDKIINPTGSKVAEAIKIKKDDPVYSVITTDLSPLDEFVVGHKLILEGAAEPCIDIEWYINAEKVATGNTFELELTEAHNDANVYFVAYNEVATSEGTGRNGTTSTSITLSVVPEVKSEQKDEEVPEPEVDKKVESTPSAPEPTKTSEVKVTSKPGKGKK